MALLSRVADRIYWAARYIERAEDSARVLRSFGELLADIPNVDAANWQSLVTIAGSDTEIETNGNGDESQERLVVRFLMSDQEHANSIHQTVESCRSNLRTCREVVPREAWETVNDLTLYVRPSASRSLDRRPIDGPEVVRFLLFDHRFPRSVAGCLAEVRSSLLRLPANDDVLRALEHADQELHQSRPAADDGAALDAAMERVQGALAKLHNALAERYLEF